LMEGIFRRKILQIGEGPVAESRKERTEKHVT
jgi:hypothetical protein